MANKVYTIQAGDTLTQIAKDHGVSVDSLLVWNQDKITDPNVIYAGDTIYVYRDDGKADINTPATWTKPVIRRFGLLSGTDRTIYVSWLWGKKDTDHYEVYWRYSVGDNIAIDAGKTTVEETNGATYTAPEEAVYVACEVLPIAKTKTENDKEVPIWTAQRSETQRYYFKDNPPGTPEDPKCELKNLILSGYLDDIDTVKLNADYIQFQIFKNDESVYKNITAKISNLHAAFSCAVPAGAKYKVRCRAIRGKLLEYGYGTVGGGLFSSGEIISSGSGLFDYGNCVYGEWTKFTDNFETPPLPISGITDIRATSETSVYLEWTGSETATKYDIEYTTKKEYFDGSDQTTTINDVTSTHYEKTGLETGTEYFFRVRAVNDHGESPWSEPKSVIIGTKPAAPTTWSSTTTAIVGEPLNLYWVHNAEDGSSQTYAELELTIGGTTETKTIKNSTDEEEKDKTSVYSIDTNSYSEGTKIYWRVRTAGVTGDYGEWSVQRIVDIYASPTLELTLTNVNSEQINTITAFPFYAKAIAGPKTQSPIGYHVSIISNQIYTTIDNIGNEKMVNVGEAIYSKYFDTNDPLVVEFSANNLNLDTNMRYTLICVAVMDSGLTVESSCEFTVTWTDMQYWPNASIAFDGDTLAAYVNPNCYNYTTEYKKVTYDSTTDKYTLSTETVNPPDNHVSTGKYTETGEEVYSVTTSDGSVIYYTIIETGELVPDVTLSVYRREYDGSFTEIETGIDNMRHTFVTDPHPSLDYARYRIVATVNFTGAVSYYDVPGIYVGEKAVIIQWDEEWSNFDSIGEEKLDTQQWAGSLLKLPYNIDVSNKYAPDVELVEYIGRAHPVTYYGTQIGETATWSMEIDKSDKDTLYALRRLSKWMGDVYVREPSGSGYWANIVVSFSQRHCELTIPVTLDITRVEGGV